VLEYLEGTDFSAWIRSELWGWPLALTVHALGTALVVGFVIIIGLRLLGLFEAIPYTSLQRLFPVIWVGLALQLLSGVILWMAKPTRYVADGAFVLKVLLIVVGVALTLSFYGLVKREAASWEAKGAISSRALTFVAATLLVWCTVVIAGRLTGYLGAI